CRRCWWAGAGNRRGAASPPSAGLSPRTSEEGSMLNGSAAAGRVRFGVVGVNHNHIYGQVGALLGAGAELVSFFAPEADLAAEFAARYPQARRVGSAAEVLEDETIQLVASAAIPDERGPL